MSADSGPGGEASVRGPRYGSSPPKSGKTGWRRLFTWKAFLLAVLGVILLGMAAVGVAFAVIDRPDPNDFSTSDTTIVYFDDGTTELGRFSAENRQIVNSEEIPNTLKLATVAAEDRSFYENPGFDITGIARAAWGAATGESAGGGSTITQQYVKNYYLTQDQTITRKLREIVIAVKVDQDVDKDQILVDYLNTIWFGRGTYGVQTAARSYFGVDVADLDLARSAALAAILRSPARYDPTLGEENAARFQARFDYVLDGMVEIGAIDRATADATVLPEILPEQSVNRFGGPNGYLLMMVRDELIAQGFDEAEIETGGLRVTSSFNAQAQAAAVAAVDQERPSEAAERVHVGLASVRPGDGAVVAVYGGPDAVSQTVNDATATVQGGSTVKPFTLAAALENGESLRSRFYGNSPFEDPALGPPVNNQDDRDWGNNVTLLRATENSVNTAFVDVTMEMGSEKVVDALTRAGFPEDAPDLNADPRVTLGIAKVSAVEMAGAYATLAAQGVEADPYVVASVADREGEVRYQHESNAERVFAEDIMADVSYALSEVVESGTGERAQELDRVAAGKTGTHEELTAWFAGYTPQLATAVAYFRGEGEALGTESLNGVAGMETFTGGRYPAATWTTFMQGALEGQPEEEFPERANVNGSGGGDDDGDRNDRRDRRDRDDDDDDENGDESGGDESGGDESGGDESGGDESGGDESGGDESGADESGADESGAEWGTDSGTEGGGTEGGTDTGGDESGTETGGAESGTETGGAESGTETGGAESGTDSGTETGADSGTESGADTGTESGADTGTESGADTGTETGTETGTDTGTEADTETSAESGANPGAAAGVGSHDVAALPPHRLTHVSRRRF